MTSVQAEQNYTQVLEGFISNLRSLNPEATFSVILIGSVARGTQMSESDVDLLIISDKDIDISRTIDRLHVQQMSEQTFRLRLHAGDDFPAWCVRFGVPLVSSKAWLTIANSSDASIWPDWHRKTNHALRRLFLASALMRVGDQDAAAEEMLYAVSHAARALLLQAGVFPLSRPEMIQQLQEHDHPFLAKLLSKLLFDDAPQKILYRALRYTKKLLLHLDRAAYQRHLEERRVVLEQRKNHSEARPAP